MDRWGWVAGGYGAGDGKGKERGVGDVGGYVR